MSTPFENAALGILREAAKDVRANGLPGGITFRHDLAAVIRDTYRGGELRMAEVMAQAYGLFTENDDLYILRAAIRDALPPGHPLRDVVKDPDQVSS